MIAIIPARGGSKGLPGKNIKVLEGKPMIAYAIDEAIKAKGISKIIVSTDSQEIADVAMKYGAEVPFLRPAELASDTALAVDNYIYTMGRLEKEENTKISSFVVLQPTSPLRTSEDIEGAIELFQQKKADSVISFCEEHHPISWHRKISKEGLLLPIFEERIGNRQEEDTTYYPNGAVFVFSMDLIRQKSYYSDKSYAYVMPRKNSVDVDTLEDFEYAEYLLQKRNKQQ